MHAMQETQEEDENGFRRRERFVGKWERRFQLPENVSPPLMLQPCSLLLSFCLPAEDHCFPLNVGYQQFQGLVIRGFLASCVHGSQQGVYLALHWSYCDRCTSFPAAHSVLVCAAVMQICLGL